MYFVAKHRWEVMKIPGGRSKVQLLHSPELTCLSGVGHVYAAAPLPLLLLAQTTVPGNARRPLVVEEEERGAAPASGSGRLI